MKKILISLIACMALVFAASAQVNSQPSYQDVQLWKMWSSGTVITLPGGAATNINAVMDVRGQKSVALQITLNPKTTATDAKTFFFTKSLDGTTYDSSDPWSVALAPGGTAGTENTVITNIPDAWVHGVGYVKLVYATNASAAAGVLSNCVVKYAIKKNAP